VNDIVRVHGAAGEPTMVARQIEVTFAASTSAGGVVTAKGSAHPAFLILNGIVTVSVADDAFIVSGGRLRSFAEIPLGRVVTAWGAPGASAGFGGVFHARVIVF
jgi:hypothetical protein